MPDCKSCSKPILPPSPICSYENNSYHPECLTCSICNKSLSGRKFVKEKNNKLVCEDCNALHAPKCAKCKLAFSPGQSYKKLTEDTFFHNECFKCCGPCRKPIGAEFYDVENGNFLCVDCYDKYGNDYEKFIDKEDPIINNKLASKIEPQKDADSLASNLQVNLNLNNKPQDSNRYKSNINVELLPPIERDRNSTSNPTSSLSSSNSTVPSSSNKDDPADKCANCNQKLVGTYTVYDDKKYHSKCFVCSKCNQEFKEKTFFKLNGKPCCRTCHSMSLVESAVKCQKCSQPILDTIVTFKTGKFHDYCLVCEMCNDKLVGKSIYTDKNEKPFCTDCFTKKEGKACAKCIKIIAPNQSNLVFENKNFHKECFRCHTCSKQINASESFYKTGDSLDSVICANCA